MPGSAVFAGAAGGGGTVGDVITAVALLVAEPDPPAFEAVTVTRSVLPTSAEPSAYCVAEPPTELQLEPAVSHRFHW